MLTFIQSEEDAIYEQDIIKDPTSIKPWLSYIDFKLRHGNLHEQAFVLERACSLLPRSYKLWKMVRRLYLRRIQEWLLIDVVPHVSHTAPAEAQLGHLRTRVLQSQCSVRKGTHITEQDAKDMGDVPRISSSSATYYPHAQNV